MFDFFKIKKRKAESAKSEPEPQKQVEDYKMDIHVMPERFRNQPAKHDSAQKAGLIIMISGVVFLIATSAILYYFLFRKPKPAQIKEPISYVENKIQDFGTQEPEIPETQNATGTSSAVLPPDDGHGAEVASTSADAIIQEESNLALRTAVDGDSDGLSDAEEIILGSDIAVLDTDADGYADGQEVKNLYNPAGAGKLSENPNVASHENKTFFYALLYPSAWQTAANGGDDSLMIKAGDNQFVQIIAQPNVNEQTLDRWYEEQLGLASINESDRITGSEWNGIKSPDGLNVYAMDLKHDRIFSISYNLGGANTLDYFNIFQMMVKSFNLKD